jgi:hypothetical protein
MARRSREASLPSHRDVMARSSREASIASSRDMDQRSREASYSPDSDQVGRPSVRREASRLGREASFLTTKEAGYPDIRLPGYLAGRQAINTGYMFAGRDVSSYLDAGSYLGSGGSNYLGSGGSNYPGSGGSNYLGSGGSNYGTLETMSARSFGYMVPQPPPTHWENEAAPR